MSNTDFKFQPGDIVQWYGPTCFVNVCKDYDVRYRSGDITRLGYGTAFLFLECTKTRSNNACFLCVPLSNAPPFTIVYSYDFWKDELEDSFTLVCRPDDV